MLQTHSRLRNGGRKTKLTTLRPVGVRRVTETLVDRQEFPLVEQTHIGARRRSRLSLRHAAVLAVFAPAAVAILYFGAPPSSSAQKELDPVSTMAVASFTTTDQPVPSFEPPPTPRVADDS